MRSGISRKEVQVVEWRTPFGSSISPYINRVPAVRRLSYARLQAALDMVHSEAAGRVLDFGCWDGHFLPSLLKHFNDVWGVDDDSASVIDRVPGCWTTLNVARKLCEFGGGFCITPWTDQGHRLGSSIPGPMLRCGVLPRYLGSRSRKTSASGHQGIAQNYKTGWPGHIFAAS